LSGLISAFPSSYISTKQPWTGSAGRRPFFCTYPWQTFFGKCTTTQSGCSLLLSFLALWRIPSGRARMEAKVQRVQRNKALLHKLGPYPSSINPHGKPPSRYSRSRIRAASSTKLPFIFVIFKDLGKASAISSVRSSPCDSCLVPKEDLHLLKKAVTDGFPRRREDDMWLVLQEMHNCDVGRDSLLVC
jgi:hypothetical protein